MDFDRLRKGVIHPTAFTRGMALAGVDKFLSSREIELIRDHYTQQVRESGLQCCCWYTHVRAEAVRCARTHARRHASFNMSPVLLRQEAPTLEAFRYRDFLADVDIIFTQQNLEKQPLAQVPSEPADLLDRDRYMRSSIDLVRAAADEDA